MKTIEHATESPPDVKPMRDYQRTAFVNVRKSLAAGHRHTILQAATGSGKTRIAAEIVRSAVAKGSRCAFFAPRRELIYQIRDALAELDLQVGVIMADEPSDPDAPVQVVSFDTLNARGKTSEVVVPPADLVIVDECHLSVAKTRLAILRKYGDTCIIGLTATPAGGLGVLYHNIVPGPSVSWLVANGHLVPVDYYAPRKPNLAGVKTYAGDYQQRSLSARMNTPEEISGTVTSWREYASDRSTIVFCVTRDHGMSMCGAFLRADVTAEYLDGDTPLQERKDILARVESGETQVLVNILVATFGTDIPRLSCVILARPTQDVTLYLQTVGRVLRTCREIGKRNAIVLDLAGAVLRHGFVDRVRPWTLEDDKNINEMTERQACERRDPKEMVCEKCKAVFSGVRLCPKCGFDVVPAGKAIPIYRLETDGPDLNSPEGQEAFCATAKAMQEQENYKEGWLAHRFFDCFGQWPSAELKAIEPTWASNETLFRVRRQMREYADRRRIASLRAKGLYGGEAWTPLL